MDNIINNTNCNYVKRFFFRRKIVDIVSIEYSDRIGYHFKITNPCNKGEIVYSMPFTTQEECEKGSLKVIKSGDI